MYLCSLYTSSWSKISDLQRMSHFLKIRALEPLNSRPSYYSIIQNLSCTILIHKGHHGRLQNILKWEYWHLQRWMKHVCMRTLYRGRLPRISTRALFSTASSVPPYCCKCTSTLERVRHRQERFITTMFYQRLIETICPPRPESTRIERWVPETWE